MVIGIAVIAAVAFAARRRAPLADTRAAVVSALRALLPATLFALIVVLLGLLTVLIVEAPASGLIVHVPAMMLDSGARLMTVAGTAVGVYAFRRPTRLAVGDWSRRHRVPASMATIAARQLQRLRVVRTVPALLGLAIGTATAPAYNVAVSVLGDGHPASRALLDAATTYSAFVLALVGYLLGSLLAEVTRRPLVRGVGARLEERRPDQYLTATARRLPAVLAIWVVAAMAAGALAGRPQPWWLALVAAAVPAVIALAQHHIVRRPQPVIDADALALDDTLRSSAAHALSGSASALLLAWALDATQYAVTDDPFTLGTAGAVLGIVGVMGIYGVWAHYGSTHRGRRPERRAAPETPDTPEAVTS